MSKEEKIKLAEAYLNKIVELMKTDFDGTKESSASIIRIALGWCMFNKNEIIK